MPEFLKKSNEFNFEYLNAKDCLNVLSDEEKNELVEYKTDIEFEAGEVIIKRGMSATNVLYVTKGLVKLEIVNESKPYTIGLIESHSFIGIMCCFAFEKFDFTATALENTKVSFIERKTFEKFIKQDGDFSLSLIRHMSGVANSLFHKVTTLSQKNIEGAISILLLDFSRIYKASNFRLPLSRIELANMLGYSKESVINTLSKFNKEEIINVTDRDIEILDRKRLTQIAKLG